MTWLLERLGVACMALAAWSRRAATFFEALAIRLIVRARPIPQAPPLPRIVIPSNVPSVDIGRNDEETLTATTRDVVLPPRIPLFQVQYGDGSVRVHADQWMRHGGVA